MESANSNAKQNFHSEVLVLIHKKKIKKKTLDLPLLFPYKNKMYKAQKKLFISHTEVIIIYEYLKRDIC